jgi:hypothetical protein
MVLSDWSLAVVGAIVLVAFLAGVQSLLNRAGGWYDLSKTYPRPLSERPLRRWWMASGRVGRAYYSSCLIVGVGVGGLFLSCVPPFNIATAPLYIPWNALTFVARWKLLWVKHLRLQTHTGTPIDLYGIAADLVDRAGPWPPEA